MNRPLLVKLGRELWGIRGQAAAIAAVIGAGIALFVLMISTYQSLDLTERTYYRRYRFAEVFASLNRAPLALERRIAEIPGVERVETRVVRDVLLDVPGVVEPAEGRLISIPADRRPVLNDLFLRAGRWIEPGRRDEVLISGAFANAHHMAPGDRLAAIVNGRRRELRIVGIALSPEYVYSIRAGEILPDDRRFAVIWMERRGLAAAFDMEGAFDDVALTLSPGASEPDVISRLDRLLKPYGGLGAIPRRLQISHWYLESELASLRSIGAIMPIVFLAVAAFLLNVVLGRIVAVQRGQIAILKAMGYDDRSVALHYLQWALAVALVGAVVGLGAGAWLGAGMTRMYTSFFSFPILRYRLAPAVALEALAVALVAAVGGALGAVRRVIALPPAEALRPEPPGMFRRGVLDRPRWRHLLTQPTRILLRNLRRHPGRAGLSVLGIAFGEALLIVGAFTLDSMTVVMRDTFQVAQRFDEMVTFAQPRSASALDEVTRWPGVLAAEPFRAVPVRLSAGHRSRQTALTGLPPDGELNRIVGGDHRVVEVPPRGLVLSKALADLLGVRVGDRVTAEVLEGRRPVLTLPVAKLVDDAMGTNAYLSDTALHRALGEGGTLSGAYLRVDPARLDDLHRKLKQVPTVAGEMIKRAAIESFDRTLAEFIGEMRTVMVAFAAIIAFGVVYNATRISLAERERELATLRVIGFRRAEIAYILLGEIAIVVLFALPLGLLLGYAMAGLTVQAYQTEVYRLPLVVSPRTHAFAAIVTVAATAISSWIVRRRLQRLDLIGVLKTRE